MRNVLTVDVEEWYHPSLAGARQPRPDDDASRLATNVRGLLDLLARHRARATFFVVGSIAERKPGVVGQIREAGHDLGVHGHDHRLLGTQTPTEFERDLARALQAIEAAAGARPRGFRAPSWSMTRQTEWAYAVLERLGLDYDASVFPFRTFLYGMPGAPRFPYYPQVDGRPCRVLEIPMSTVRLGGRNLPFSGGFYLRLLPLAAVRAGIRRINREGHPALVYVHPWELDPQEKRLDLSPGARCIQYLGVARSLRKLTGLLEAFEFTSIEALLDAGLLAGGKA